MKIMIVTSFPFPEGKATANRVKVFAQELIKTDFIKEYGYLKCVTQINMLTYS